MTLSIIQSGQAAPATSTTIVFTISTPSVGNILLAFCSYSQFGNARTINTPSGWVKQDDNTGAGLDNTDSQAVFTRVVQAGDSTGYTFTVSGASTDNTSGAIYEITGANTSTPVNQSGFASDGGATTAPTASITPSVLGCLAVAGWSTDSNSTETGLTAGWTLDQSATGTFHTTFSAHQNALTSDTVTAVSATLTTTTSGPAISTIVLIAPGSAPATGPPFYPASQAIRARLPSPPAGTGSARGQVRSNPGSNPARLLLNSFEGGTAGTTISTGNSGGSSGNAFDTVNIGAAATLTYDIAESDAAGFTSGKFSTGGSSANDYVAWSKQLGLQTQVWFRAYCYFTVFTGNCRLIRVLTPSGTLCATIQVNSSGKVQTLDSANAAQTTSTLALPVNRWFRLEGYFTGSANAGQIQVKIFVSNPYGTVPDETDTSGTAVSTIGTFGQINYGNPSSVTNYTFWLDNLGVSNTGYIGPVNPLQYGALRSPVQARIIPLSASLRGRISATPPAVVHITPPVLAGPPFYPRPYPAQAQDPLSRHGRVYSGPGGPVRNPVSGPVFRQVTSPVRAHVPQVFSKGRVSSSPGSAPANPAAGPIFRQAVKPARAPVPQTFSKGRIASNPGSQPRNPTAGPAVYALQGPVRTRTAPPFSKGRVSSNPGAPVRNPVQGPVFYQKPFPVQARIPLPKRGRTYSNPGGPLQNPPALGPAFRQAVSPAKARLPQQPVLRGRVYSNPGGPVQNPVPSGIGPVFFPRNYPARIRPSLPVRGRITFNATVQNPNLGPVFRQATTPARSRVPQVFSKGRVSSSPGLSVYSGPVFRQATSPARIRVTLPPRGRIASNPGGPVQNPVPGVTGPPFYPFRSPARVHPVLPPRGRITSSPGAPVRNPGGGPAFRQAAQPARARVPQAFSKGRASGSQGAAAYSGPPFRQAPSPARIRPSLPPRGRVTSNPGGPVQNPPPVVTGPVFFPARSPARIRPSLPPRGRTSSNAGAPVRNPHAGPPVYPQHGPAGLANRAPGPFRKGSAQGNPGGPVVAVVQHGLRFTFGSPRFQWAAEEPYTGWETGKPGFQWAAGEPYTGWETGEPGFQWAAEEPYLS